MDINLLQQIIDAPKIRKYASPKITRAGLSTNPVERLNFTGGTIFSNDQLVKHGGAFFIGGDTATHEFDFSTKVAGSVAECPMKIHWGSTNNGLIQPFNGDVYPDNTQTVIDKFKSSDGNYQTFSSYDWNPNIAGYTAQFIVELDLTPLCNALFGGSNAALKAALKSITADVWAMGSGAGGNGVSVKTYDITVPNWANYNANWYASNTSGSISKMTITETQFVAQNTITSGNKLYLLIASSFASDGVTASSVSLDYLNIKIDIARTPDTVSPISVNLPKYWAMVVKGWSPNFDTLDTKIHYMGDLKQNGYEAYIYRQANGAVQFGITDGSTYDVVTTPVLSISKFQTVNFLATKTVGKIQLRYLINNGTVSSPIEKTTTKDITGKYDYRIGTNSVGGENANAFAESFNLVDLQRLGKQNGFTDAEATAILQGVLPNPLGLTNPELFDISKVTLHANAQRVGDSIVLNATTATVQSSYVAIPVFPNNTYRVKGTISSGARIKVGYYYNGIFLSWGNTSANVNDITFTAPNNCNSAWIYLDNSSSATIGTFTFSNISLKRKD